MSPDKIMFEYFESKYRRGGLKLMVSNTLFVLKFLSQ